jgi:flagellar protein FliT
MPQMLIDYYKAIEDSSARMLDAARAEDWDDVVRYEGACAVLIEQLRHRSKCEQLNEAARLEKSRIMQRILSNDAQIRYLTEPWLSHCEQKFEGQRLLH